MAGMISVGMSVFSDRAYHMERVLRYLGGGLPGQTRKDQVLYQDQGPVAVSRTMELGTMGIEAHESETTESGSKRVSGVQE